MNKLILAVISIFLCSAAYAGPKKSLADLDKELKQAKSTETIMGLLGQLEQAVPETEADMAILGQMLDQYPDFARKATLNINNPKLAKAVMKETKKQIDSLKLAREKDWDKLPKEERQQRFNSLMNTYALFGTLGKLKNKEAVPFLKQYITPEYDGALSYNASQALGFIGDETALDEMVRDIGKTKEIDLSAFGDKAFVKIVKELDEPGLKPERKLALINQIKGSRSPERKKALKELALGHKDRVVRDRCGLALLNSMIANPQETDKEFIKKWVKATKNTEAGYWAVVSIRTSHENGSVPLGGGFAEVVIDVLRTSNYEPTRAEVTDILGRYKVTESLPQLEVCVAKDVSASVRGGCRAAYYAITGKVPLIFHQDDIIKQKARFRQPRTIEFYDRLSDTNPDKMYYLEMKRAVEEYERQHK